ncbi:MAG: hypothetical protein VX346_23260 [Planctomycetota bacterium]|nr:hypothetical protein [Planctomycetota bacterium]
MYGNPQYGHPSSQIYHRKFGLSLWRAGYHGAVSYACQHAMTWHPWNDVANGRFSKMTYPTTAEAALRPRVDAMRSWLDQLDVTTGFDAIRSGMIEKILALQQDLAAAR